MSSAVPTFDERGKARELIKDIAGECWRGRGDMIDRVFDAVSKRFPASGWTRRRIRSFWHSEAAGVRWGEMRELEFVAEVERIERIRRDAARAAHSEFLIDIENTLDRLEIADAEFYSAHRSAIRQMASGQADREIRSHASQGHIPPIEGGSMVGGAY